ncbi:MAG: mucoidy inhibitor MuiA family protein [Myxococcota bacterium]
MNRLFPPIDPALTEMANAVTRVTLLEDRALVRREGRISLDAGRHRLVLVDVSPVLQDVSLQAGLSSGEGRVADVRMRRAYRILAEDRPEEATKLEAEIESTGRTLDRLDGERASAQARLVRVQQMVAQASQEVSLDAAWGRSDAQTWQRSFSALFERARESAERDLNGYHLQQDAQQTLANLVKQRQALDRLDQHITGWIGLDLDVPAAGDIGVFVEYIVPCALWRPIHTARWVDATLELSTAAVLWQNTGEDWADAELHFSTSRSSLGHEPPMLVDDPLSAERKDDEISVELREVDIEQAAVEGIGGGGASSGGASPPQPTRADLPGVDDGGRTRHLVATGRHRVPSDGRPVRIPLGRFEAPANAELIAAPELALAAVWRVVADHAGAEPLLAGPVELVRQYGPVGWTDTRFVAPRSTFELGFGPDDSIRVDRTVAQEKVDGHPDDWPAVRRTVDIYLSNLDDAAKQIKVVERVPVSEVEEVRVLLQADQSTSGYSVDDDGRVTWPVTLQARENRTLRLVWVLASSPKLAWSLD